MHPTFNLKNPGITIKVSLNSVSNYKPGIEIPSVGKILCGCVCRSIA